MSRVRAPLGGIALSWAAAFAIASAASAAEPSLPDWFPLGSGNRWVYSVHRDHSFQPEKGSIERFFHNGRSTQVAERAPGKPESVFRINEATVLQPAQGGSSEATAAARVLTFDDGGLRLLGSTEARPHTRPTDAVFDPPLKLLPTTTVGETWKVGTYREGDLQIELRGEIVGVEDLVDPVCNGCLKVRYRGKPSGSIPIYQGNASVESGTFERIMWFERGVGIVREVATTDSALRLPDGATARVFAVTTMRLVEHAVAK